MHASGTFTVALESKECHADAGENATLNRMTIDKQFSGELVAHSKGEMLSAMTLTQGSAAYVAIEYVVGALAGRNGSFILQHYGKMEKGQDSLILEVVPDSATQELEGLSGKMSIDIIDSVHHYQLDYSL